MVLVHTIHAPIIGFIQCLFQKFISISCICSGHVNFSDEATAAFRLCDGVVIFIDAAEGVRKIYAIKVLRRLHYAA